MKYCVQVPDYLLDSCSSHWCKWICNETATCKRFPYQLLAFGSPSCILKLCIANFGRIQILRFPEDKKKRKGRSKNFSCINTWDQILQEPVSKKLFYGLSPRGCVCPKSPFDHPTFSSGQPLPCIYRHKLANTFPSGFHDADYNAARCVGLGVGMGGCVSFGSLGFTLFQ